MVCSWQMVYGTPLYRKLSLIVCSEVICWITKHSKTLISECTVNAAVIPHSVAFHHKDINPCCFWMWNCPLYIVLCVHLRSEKFLCTLTLCCKEMQEAFCHWKQHAGRVILRSRWFVMSSNFSPPVQWLFTSLTAFSNATLFPGSAS